MGKICVRSDLLVEEPNQNVYDDKNRGGPNDNISNGDGKVNRLVLVHGLEVIHNLLKKCFHIHFLLLLRVDYSRFYSFIIATHLGKVKCILTVSFDKVAG